MTSLVGFLRLDHSAIAPLSATLGTTKVLGSSPLVSGLVLWPIQVITQPLLYTCGEPLFYGDALIREPVSCDHRIPHDQKSERADEVPWRREVVLVLHQRVLEWRWRRFGGKKNSRQQNGLNGHTFPRMLPSFSAFTRTIADFFNLQRRGLLVPTALDRGSVELTGPAGDFGPT